MVPVLRPPRNCWEFGTVEEVDDTEKRAVEPSRDTNQQNNEKVNGRGSRYRIRFMDDEIEWVVVERDTYVKYVEAHEGNIEVASRLPSTDHQESAK